MTIKKQPLYDFITPKFIKDCINKGIIYQQDIATEVKRLNGGTCSASTINGYMKKFGLVPDKPTGKIYKGIDIKEVQETYGLLKPYQLSPLPAVISSKIQYYNEDMVLMISDLQIGALDTDDGFDPVPEATIKGYVDTLLTNLIQRYTETDLNLATERFHLFLLGDIVDGELIYPAQSTIDMSSQMRLAIRMILRIIEVLQQIADEVHVYSVAGNHGRVSFRSHKVSNWDNAVFDTIDLVYEDSDQVFVHLDNHDVVKIAKIGKWKFLYTHGHLIRGMVDRKKLKDKTQDWFFSVGEFDASLFGHWHTVHWFDINGKPALINGCAYKSEYIRKQIGGVETLGMIMFKVGDNRPVEWLEILDIK